MAGRFIFRKDVEDVIKRGQQEILVSSDARISSEALDLLKERNIRIKYAQEGSSSVQDRDSLDSPSMAGDSELADVTDAEIQKIVERVIERIREIKHDDIGQPASREARENDDDMIICRCEEITKGEIKEAIRNGIRTLNGIKRITRAGMGLCQGQTCERLISQILSEELGIGRDEIEPTTARAPVRPVSISVFATG